MAEEQNQSGEMMFYAGMLQDHLRRIILKRIHSTYRPPRNLWEAFDLTLEFKKEYQITQLQTDFVVMETCYEDLTAEDVFTSEEVQTQSQSQKQGQYPQGNWPQYQKQQNNGQKSYQGDQNWTGNNEGYKSQYEQGSKQQQQGNKPYYQLGYQSQGYIQGQEMHQPRMDFGMVLPAPNFGLEQFLKMTKALKWVEDKYKNQPHNFQQKLTGSTKIGPKPNKENQKPDEMMNLTSCPSLITKSIQIGKMTVEQIAQLLDWKLTISMRLLRKSTLHHPRMIWNTEW